MFKVLYDVQGADRRADMYGDRSCFKCHKVFLHMTKFWFYFICEFGYIVYVDFFFVLICLFFCVGLFSVIMRDLANMSGDGPKWIVLDGDIDPMWIESLNTVMDDNKVLTLASNERIPLTPSMRLLFEISHLKTATPATVSRAGILFINPADLGWNP